MNINNSMNISWEIVNETNWRAVREHGHTIPKPSEFKRAGRLSHIRLGKYEIEHAARTLVDFFLETGDVWKDFTLEELSKYCSKRGHGSAGLALFGLICIWHDDSMGWRQATDSSSVPLIVQTSEKHFAITTAFIEVLILAH